MVAPGFDREAALAGSADHTIQCDPVAEMLSRRWNRRAAPEISSRPIARHCQISAQQTSGRKHCTNHIDDRAGERDERRGEVTWYDQQH